MPRLYLLPIALLVLSCATEGLDAAIIIDTFDTAQTAIVIPTIINIPTSVASGPGILGIERDFGVVLVSGQGTSVQANFGGSGMLEHGQLGAAKSTTLVAWDGADGDASTLDATGLGGVDLTAAGTLSGIAVGLAVNDVPAPMTLSAYTDAGNWSSATIILPGGIPPAQVLFIPFASFVIQAGVGVDFTNLGAFTLFIDGGNVSGLDVQLKFIEAANPTPEPGSLALVGLGSVLIWGAAKVRNRARRRPQVGAGCGGEEVG